MPDILSRRAFLTRATALGCSAAASPLWSRVSFAAAPWDTRLVVIILRGGMDGLDVVRPYGAPEYAGLRAALAGGAQGGAAELDGFFGLHPALSELMPLWRKGQLGFVHAVSTPYRDKRSHFDGQDILEAGTARLQTGVHDGWLNRMLQHLPGIEARTAFALGHGEMKVLAGPATIANWAPDSDLVMSPQAERLMARVMQDDPAFHAAFSEALMLSADTSDGSGGGGSGAVQIAQFAAEQMRADTRIVSFSLNGWDTHGNQSRTLLPALKSLAATITTLHDGVGADVWDKTAVVAMTEFGRTAAINGTGGTDHGTGGVMVLAGGALRGGRVHGHWPGLAEADLYARRDLMPTGDVRAAAAWILRGASGLDRAVLEQAVFPGLDMGGDPGLML
ncbi:DUF1501 domain-containing protein [Pseudodonghicola xiamenensis]|uniref:Tat (Twin-arginine translocation) pathway signal sequence n=1 Tax=Pseudodonghicola xiamenensis TaxID=337702 RepID=A0A8J3MF32_9RHOB|nr:DUF1501 domain-containing protein [Pseudodonghicola xiamenensis]GHH01606.1 hypothetical protein GCM10010961_38920 [Pseudodonghicola xiamenensis]